MEIEIKLHEDDLQALRDKLQAGSTDNSDSVRLAKLKRLLSSGCCDVDTLKHIPKLTERRLHELLENATIVLPSPPEPPPRSAELEARIQKYKLQQERKEYDEMTKDLNPGASGFFQTAKGEKSFGEELGSMNRHLTLVANTLLTVGGAFVFGFKGIEYAMPSMEIDITTRVMIGMTLATIVFFADLYFIAKSVNLE